MVLQCSLVVVLVLGRAIVASSHLRAAASRTITSRSIRTHYPAGGCQFVAHRPDDTEEVLSSEGPHVLFRKGEVVVVEKTPMRYLVSLAEDGTCNEQAEQLCHTLASGSNATSSCDSAQCVAESNGDTLLSYLRSMLGGVLASRPPPGRSVVVGLGSGAMASWLGGAFPDGSVDAVDLNPNVIAAAPCFGLHPSARIQLIEADGRSLLSGAANFAYDAIFLDAFDASGLLPPCLATSEFFELVAKKLAPDQGVLAVNLGLATSDEPGQVLAAIRKTFLHVAVGQAPHLTNHLVLASQTELTIPSSELGPAELLSPGSVAANLTRWARQASFKPVGKGESQDVPRTDAGEGCAVSK